MSKGKLAKFADMETYENVFQYPFSVVEHVPFEMKGHWHEQYFKNDYRSYHRSKRSSLEKSK